MFLRNTILVGLLLAFTGCSPPPTVPDAKRVVTDHYREIAAGRHKGVSSAVIAKLGSYASHKIVSTHPPRSAFHKKQIKVCCMSTYAKGGAEECFDIGRDSSGTLVIVRHYVIYR